MDEYKRMFEVLLVFVPVLMILSYLAGTSHDMKIKSRVKDPLLGFKLRAASLCTSHIRHTRKPAKIVLSDKCDMCRQEGKKA